MSEHNKLILAFDTCFQACSVALIDHDSCLHSRYEEMETGHVERLVPMISSLMEEAQVAFQDIDIIATTVGPGTFTGTRIGIAAAQGFSMSLNRPVYSVTSLTIMARKALSELSQIANDQTIIIAVNARRDEVYVQGFGDTVPRGLKKPSLLSANAVARALKDIPAIVVGTGADAIAKSAQERGVSCQARLDNLQPDAAFFNYQDLTPCEHLRPLYLRPPDAKPPTQKSISRAQPQ